MTTKQMFIPRIDANGEEYFDMTPPGVLLIAADTLHGDSAETTQEGMKNAKLFIDSLLSASVGGGFKQRDILETLLARKPHDRRTVNLAHAACDAAGTSGIREIFARFGL